MNPSAYFASHIWAMDPTSLRALRCSADGIKGMIAAGITTTEKVNRVMDGQRILQASIVDGVATVPVHGALINAPPVWMHLMGDITDLSELTAILGELAANPDVSSVMLDMDSPGGTVSGTAEACAAVAMCAASGKSVTATCSGMCASGAYWIASAAQLLTGTPGAMWGSIGVYTVLQDTSKADEMDGVSYTLVSSGGVKGAGADGKVTPAAIAETQRKIDGMSALFRAAVAKNRGMSATAVADVATGQMWFSSEAKTRGLINDVTGIDDAASSRDESMSPVITADHADGGNIPTAKQHASKTMLPLPVSTPKPPQSGTTPMTMKLSAIILAALIKDAPDRAALVIEKAEAGMDETAIRAELIKANHADLVAQVETMGAEVKSAGEKLAAEVAAKSELKKSFDQSKAEVAALQLKFNTLSAMGAGANRDPGSAAGGEGDDTPLAGEDAWRSEFKASRKIQDMYALGGVGSYVAMKREEANGKQVFRKTAE